MGWQPDDLGRAVPGSVGRQLIAMSRKKLVVEDEELPEQEEGEVTEEVASPEAEPEAPLSNCGDIDRYLRNAQRKS